VGVKVGLGGNLLGVAVGITLGEAVGGIVKVGWGKPVGEGEGRDVGETTIASWGVNPGRRRRKPPKRRESRKKILPTFLTNESCSPSRVGVPQ